MPVTWNSVTSTDGNKLEHIQQNFAALCFNCSSPHVHYSYTYALEDLKLNTLCKRRFPVQVCFCSEFYPLLETVDLQVSAHYIRLQCSVSALQVKIVLLNVLQLLGLSVGTLMYLEPRLFLLNIFCNGTCIIIKIYVIIYWLGFPVVKYMALHLCSSPNWLRVLL